MKSEETHQVCDLTGEQRCVAFLRGSGSQLLAGVLVARAAVTLGDALAIRDELLAGGFVFGRDFVIRKRG